MAGEKEVQIFFIPFFASGHMIPIADLAALFGRRRPNVIPTICLTPANASFLQPTLDPNVKVLVYPFPSEAVGLPPGIENLSSVHTPEEEEKLYSAVALSESAHRKFLYEHRPDAIIADISFPWTTAIAKDIGVPRLTWHAVGLFPHVVMNSLHRKHVHSFKDNVVRVKDMPGSKAIEMPVSELPEFLRKPNSMADIWNALREVQRGSYGTVVNTVYGIESVYCDRYTETECRQAWFVGPVALARGRYSGKNEQQRQHGCMDWLDGKEEGSVVFVCFGSWCRFKVEQMREMAAGLELSGAPFLWVVREGEEECKWMPDKEWEQRVGNRGMVVRGWAPQWAVLEHRAVGAFMTHCGWNSVLESMAAGVPMLTWPLVFEQFINERLVVEVLEAGVRVFDGYRSTRDEEKVIVPAAVVAKAVSQFMGEERNGRGRRSLKARECAEMAKSAVAEGGSSWNDLNSLIDQLLCYPSDHSQNINSYNADEMKKVKPELDE